MHPTYNSNTMENDIALLRTDPIIDFTEHVIPVCLPTKPFIEYEDDIVLVSGYGHTSFGKNAMIAKPCVAFYDM